MLGAFLSCFLGDKKKRMLSQLLNQADRRKVGFCIIKKSASGICIWAIIIDTVTLGSHWLIVGKECFIVILVQKYYSCWCTHLFVGRTCRAEYFWVLAFAIHILFSTPGKKGW